MSIQSKLREMGVKFLEEDGLILGSYALDGGRRQRFAIDPDADEVCGHHEHDFLSFLGPATDLAKIQRACEIAGRMKRGGIVIHHGLLALKFEIPADLSAGATVKHLEWLVQRADAIEREVFGDDNL